ncbi:MAG: tetratricopeptide repeat protein [Myxococcales bacterium]|nr:tetratricopeptide repeat protein [Myxococcales bacterium]
MKQSRTVITATVLLFALTSFGAAKAAHGQSWAHPPLTDFDAESEDASEFWDAVLSGNGDYKELTKQATALESSRVPAQRQSALAVWEAIAKLRPADVRAHFYIGTHNVDQRNWPACAKAFAEVFAIDPSYAGPDLENPSGVGGKLGKCLLYSGNFEEAVKHFQRLVSQKYESSEIYLHLGEALMALGRLDEAIFALRQARSHARRHQRSMDRQTGYALAVALDRAEQLGESRELLRQLGRRDSQLTSLRSSDKIYAPPSEEHYYLAVASEAQDNAIRALYHFRRFLSLASESPWRMHTQSHLDGIATPKLAKRLNVSGSAQWPVKALRKAIQAKTGPLSSCLHGHPQVLVRITLSGVLSRPVSRHTARAAISAQAEVDQETLAKVVECLELAARQISMPKQSGLTGGHGNAQFSIIGMPTN